jgi:hypothetical protein
MIGCVCIITDKSNHSIDTYPLLGRLRLVMGFRVCPPDSQQTGNSMPKSEMAPTDWDFCAEERNADGMCGKLYSGAAEALVISRELPFKLCGVITL